MSARVFISLFCVGILATACGLGKLQILQGLEPRGNAFQKALAKEYRAYAEAQEQQHDFVDAQYFADKGLKAAKGNDVAPDKIENWSISRDVKPTMQQARVYLLEVLIPEVTTRVPDDAARGQFLFDCWLEQQENADDGQIPPCREEFYDVLDRLYSHKLNFVTDGAWNNSMVDSAYNDGGGAIAGVSGGNAGNGGAQAGACNAQSANGGGCGSSGYGGSGINHEDEYIATGTQSAAVQANVIENPDLTFTLYFDFNSSRLTKSAEAKISEVVLKLKRLDNYEVVISGHADRSGPKGYNVKLSQRRADNVKSRLVSDGIESNRISAFGYGELYPQMQTADGVKSKANRRARIVIREKGK